MAKVTSSPPALPARLAVVVMGVAGSGKSTVGAAIAGILGLDFVDGDALHSPLSIAKMRASTPLQDEDRWPWLDRIAACLADASRPRGVVVACSALRRTYRERLRAGAPGLRFVFLDGPKELLAARLAGRSGHYMPAALLDSQLRTLEPPGTDEADALRLDIERPAAEIAEEAVRALAARAASRIGA